MDDRAPFCDICMSLINEETDQCTNSDCPNSLPSPV
jgi:hypothetical protein